MKLFSNKQSCCYYVLPSGVHFVECKVGGFFFAFFCFLFFFSLSWCLHWGFFEGFWFGFFVCLLFVWLFRLFVCFTFYLYKSGFVLGSSLKCLTWRDYPIGYIVCNELSLLKFSSNSFLIILRIFPLPLPLRYDLFRDKKLK